MPLEKHLVRAQFLYCEYWQYRIAGCQPGRFQRSKLHVPRSMDELDGKAVIRVNRIRRYHQASGFHIETSRHSRQGIKIRDPSARGHLLGDLVGLAV